MTEEKQKKQEKRVKTKAVGRNTEPGNMQTRNTKIGENVVFIGRRPVMNYVLACLTYLNSGSDRIVVKARGRAIPRAVDTVELLRRSFAKSLQLEDIGLSTEEVAREEGQKSRVSAIEISMTKT